MVARLIAVPCDHVLQLLAKDLRCLICICSDDAENQESCTVSKHKRGDLLHRGYKLAREGRGGDIWDARDRRLRGASSDGERDQRASINAAHACSAWRRRSRDARRCGDEQPLHIGRWVRRLGRARNALYRARTPLSAMFFIVAALCRLVVVLVALTCISLIARVARSHKGCQMRPKRTSQQ